MPDPRAPGKYLHPYNVEQDGVTGHWTWHVRVEVVDENGNVMNGPPGLWGVSVEVLKSTHGGSHEIFLAEHVKPQMFKQHEDLQHGHAEAMALKGKML